MTKISLPEIDVMIEKIRESGTSDVDLAKMVKKLEKEKPYYKFNKRLTYKAICDDLHIDLNIRYGSIAQDKGEHTKVGDLTTESGQINLRGYILNIPEPYRNKKDTGVRTNIAFADETGIVSIGINQKDEDDQIDRFRMEFPNFPIGAYLLGVTAQEYQGRLSVGVPPWGNWEKIGIGDYELPELNKIYDSFHDSKTEFEENNIYYFHGLLIDKKEGNGYIGCPHCRAGLKVEEGTESPCTIIENEETGKRKGCGQLVNAIKYPSVSAMIGDKYGEVSIDFGSLSGVDIDYLNTISEADQHPEVIAQAIQTKDYGLSGRWIIPIGNVIIDKGTGKQITVGTIDQLDFSKDESRVKIPRDENGDLDFEDIEVYISTYKRFYVKFNEITPDDLAMNLKDSFGMKHEVEVQPIVQELLNRGLIKISGKKFGPV